MADITEQIPIPELGAIDLNLEIRHSREVMSKQQLDFADGVLEGKTRSQAYKDAGYVCKNDNVASANAAKLIRTHKVCRYITLRREQSGRVTGITRDYLIDCQHNNMLELNKLGEFDKSSKVTVELCKLYNFYPDPKSIIRIEDAEPNTNDFTDDEWEIAFALIDAREKEEEEEEESDDNQGEG